MSHLLPSRSRFVLDPGIAAVAAVRIPSSAAGGKESAYIHEGLIRLAANSGSTISTTATATPAATPGPITAKERPRASAPSTEEKLFNALAAAKILTSQVAMHLDDGWRKKLFRRLDDLLSVDSWDEADQALQRDSFATFLRFFLLYRPARQPSFGISHRGHLLCDWTTNRDSLVMECLPKDELRWVLVRYLEGERESAAGQISLKRLLPVLQPYEPDRWFQKHDGSIES